MKTIVEILKFLFRLYYYTVYPVRLIGESNIPTEGAAILCANHISLRDPIILLLRLKRAVSFMAKAELFRIRIVGAVLRGAGAFPVDRGRADLSAIRESMRILKAGGVLGIFPQGTRSAGNARTQMHGGAALIEQRSKAPVIPIYIQGPYRAFRKTEIRIGAPVDLSAFGTRSDSATIEQVTERIDGAIWALESGAA
ncbi:MAG: lysophospholipid acyltransferase family protein [Christensenellales bacterium]|jgi:1-acyl-sn-glycerol-3-phosphate acyltransferase